MAEINLTFGERLGDLLKESNKTQKAVAGEIGVSPSVMSDLVTDKKKQGVTAENLKKLCECLGVSADYLLGLSDVKSPDTNIQAIHDYTGLSEQSVKLLHDYHTGNKPKPTIFGYTGTINSLLENPNITSIYKGISCATSAKKVTVESESAEESNALSEKTGADVLEAERLMRALGKVDIPADELADFYVHKTVYVFETMLLEMLKSLESTKDGE